MPSMASPPVRTVAPPVRRRRWRAVASPAIGGVVSILVVSFVVFLAVEALPGDAATRLLGPNASPERADALRARLGLDRPVLARYGSWLAGVVRGDLGVTASGGATVAETVRAPARNTAILTVSASIGTAVIAVGVGLLTGTRVGRTADRITGTTNLVAVAIPDFVIATVLVIVFAFTLGWVPAVSLVPTGGTPLDRPSTLVVPTAAIAVTAGAFGARLVRAVVADAARRPHVAAARRAGIAEHRVVIHHVLPAAIGPIVRVLALLVPYLVGGTAAVERIVSYPGLGSLLVASISARDVRVVEAIVLFMASAIVSSFVIGDLIARRLDARNGGDAR